MNLGTLRASFHCILRPTIAGCTVLLLALLLIACLQYDEDLLEKASGRFLVSSMSFTDFLDRVSEGSAEIETGRKGRLQPVTSKKPGGQGLTVGGTKTAGETGGGVYNSGGKVTGGTTAPADNKAHQKSRGATLEDRLAVSIPDNREASQLPWLDQEVPYQWAECAKEGHEQGKAVCVYGPGAREAKVMQPTYFYLDMLKWKDNCYARMTGPAILVVKMRFEGLHCLRGSYTAHEPGEYQLWISCKLSHANATIRTLPPHSRVYPWHHHELVQGSPFPVTVHPNPKVNPRGCEPCTGPQLGTLPGQWISRERLSEQCGEGSLGAIGEWHDDEHVWVPRQCTLPFFSKEDFGRRFAGADIMLMGDSTVRGTFCDLQNWLHFKNGPAFYAGPFEMNADGSSNWDYKTCGYNDQQPIGKNFVVVNPNPFEFEDVHIRYFEAREPETFARGQVDIWKHVEARPGRSYRAVLVNFGLWWWHEYSPVCGPNSLIRILLDYLRCKRVGPMPIPIEEGIDPFDCDWKSALRFLGLAVADEGQNATVGGEWVVRDVVKGRCVKSFPGRIVYRSVTGKFDDHNMCTEGYKHVFDVGEVCAQKLETDRMLRESFGATSSWDQNPLVMDVFDMVYARPDRSLDSFHFFSRKCIEKPCEALTWDYEGCCYLPNVVPWSGSMSMTNLFLHQLANDPLLIRRQLPPQ